MDWTRVKALTFDCYGTLIDWEAGILRAVRPVLQVRGLRPTDAEVVRAYAELEAEAERGEYVPYREVLGRVMRGLGARFGMALEEREEDRLAESVARWEPFADTVGSLRRLGSVYRLAVCSNIDDEMFEATRAKLEQGVRFERVVTASYCRSYKPDPRHLRVALALLGLEAGEVLHVAQSRYHDIGPARGLGMRTCWVRRASVAGEAGVTVGCPEGSEAEATTADLAGVARLLGV